MKNIKKSDALDFAVWFRDYTTEGNPAKAWNKFNALKKDPLYRFFAEDNKYRVEFNKKKILQAIKENQSFTDIYLFNDDEYLDLFDWLYGLNIQYASIPRLLDEKECDEIQIDYEDEIQKYRICLTDSLSDERKQILTDFYLNFRKVESNELKVYLPMADRAFIDYIDRVQCKKDTDFSNKKFSNGLYELQIWGCHDKSITVANCGNDEYIFETNDRGGFSDNINNSKPVIL